MRGPDIHGYQEVSLIRSLHLLSEHRGMIRDKDEENCLDYLGLLIDTQVVQRLVSGEDAGTHRRRRFIRQVAGLWRLTAWHTWNDSQTRSSTTSGGRPLQQRRISGRHHVV